MKRVFIFTIILTIVLTGCSPRMYPIENSRTDTVYVEKEVHYNDTIFSVAMPNESMEVILPADTSSYLRTSVAESHASIKKGILHHTLKNISQPIAVHVLLPETTVTTSVNHFLLRTVVQKVEKPLKWWQKILIWIGVIGLLFLLIRIIIIVVKNL